MLLIGVAHEAMRRGLDPGSIIRLIPYILPESLMFALPATVLFSVCCLFGKLASNNEIVAIQSNGNSARVLIVPVLLITGLLSLIGVWMNDIAFTWSYRGVERVVLESIEPVVHNVLQREKRFETDRFSITVGKMRGREMIDPRIMIHKGDGRTLSLTAARGSIHGEPESHSLVVSLTSGTIKADHEAQLSFTDTIEQRIPLVNASRIKLMARNPSHVTLASIPNEIRQQEIDILQMNRESAVRAAGNLSCGNFSSLGSTAWQRDQMKLNRAHQRLDRLKFVPWRRWANGFSSLCFAMLGIPIAMRLKNADYATTFGICFLPVLLIYYPLFMFGMEKAKSGSFPPSSVWLGNIACIVIGAILMRGLFSGRFRFQLNHGC